MPNRRSIIEKERKIELSLFLFVVVVEEKIETQFEYFLVRKAWSLKKSILGFEKFVIKLIKMILYFYANHSCLTLFYYLTNVLFFNFRLRANVWSNTFRNNSFTVSHILECRNRPYTNFCPSSDCSRKIHSRLAELFYGSIILKNIYFQKSTYNSKKRKYNFKIWIRANGTLIF